MANTTLSGWLDKRGGQEATKGWKRRWCILSENVMKYYRSDTDTSPAGTIFAEDIDDVCIDYEESQKDSAKFGFVFRVVTKGRDYIFNAVNNAKREEWVRSMKDLLHAHRSEVAQPPDLKYATVELFINKGIRVNGDIGTVLSAQLTPGNAKAQVDDRGWFADTPLPHSTILNLFTQHGWSLATAFQSNATPPGSNSTIPSDTLVFTHPNIH